MATPYPPDPNAKISGQAIWSLVLGILSNTCLWIVGSIPAIILGILAVRKVDRSEGRVTGKGLAIAGIVTGATGVLVGLIPLSIVALVTLPATAKIQERAEISKQMSDLRQITMACQIYASDHDQKFPMDLAMLVPDYLDSEEILKWAPLGASPEEEMPYRYRPDLGSIAVSTEPFLAAPKLLAGRIAVAYADGRVEAMREEEFNAKFADSFP